MLDAILSFFRTNRAMHVQPVHGKIHGKILMRHYQIYIFNFISYKIKNSQIMTRNSCSNRANECFLFVCLLFILALTGLAHTHSQYTMHSQSTVKEANRQRQLRFVYNTYTQACLLAHEYTQAAS